MTRTGRLASSLAVWRVKTGLWPWLALSVGALGLILAAPALAEPLENGVRGFVTEVSRSAEVVLVEEDPSDESGSAKGEFAVTDETEILERQGGDLAPVAFEDLRVGQMVEATYVGPVAESYPAQGVADRIVILEGVRTNNPDDGGSAVLPDTGGAPLAVPGVLLIGGALLARRVARFSRQGLPSRGGGCQRLCTRTRTAVPFWPNGGGIPAG